jgi:hypothetical protein
MVSLKKKKDGITETLDGMVHRANTMESFFHRVIFKMYQDKQRKRWMSEGSSEGLKWPALKPSYKISKKKRFADYPGSGNKMMIATNSLYMATVEKPNKKATNKGITIAVSNVINPESGDGTQDYAKTAAQKRPFMKFSKQSIEDMRKKVLDYIKRGGSVF